MQPRSGISVLIVVLGIAVKIRVNLLLLTLFGLAGSSSAQSVGQPFIVTIQTAQSVVKVGSQIRVEVILTNTSGRDLGFTKSVGDETAESNYLINVSDGHGKPVAETAHHRRVRAENSLPVTHSNQIVTLKPGERLKEQAILNNLYDIGRPGRYVIMAQRDVPQEQGKGVVKSNAVTITVAP
jgi:hypothetical protein